MRTTPPDGSGMEGQPYEEVSIDASAAEREQ
jgi:hypothetical protein